MPKGRIRKGNAKISDEKANLFKAYSCAAIFVTIFRAAKRDSHWHNRNFFGRYASPRLFRKQFTVILPGVRMRRPRAAAAYSASSIAIPRCFRITREDVDANQERCLDETPRG